MQQKSRVGKKKIKETVLNNIKEERERERRKMLFN